MIEAILCDIDGTLVQSNWLHAAAWKDAFAVAGIDLDLEEIRKQIGKGGDELIPVFVPSPKRAAIESTLKNFRKYIFQSDYLPQVRSFPCVRELLSRLHDLGVKVSLASSADADELKIYEKIANIQDLVEQSSSSADADRSKPHPDIFQATLKKLQAAPDKVLALGDTPYDAQAARKAGISTIGVTTGGWSKEELISSGCIEVYDDVEDLLHNLEKSAIFR